jgi:hypothetical protein
MSYLRSLCWDSAQPVDVRGVPVSADSPDDWDADEVEPGPDASREPGLDAVTGRAFGELVAENAELYKRVDSLEAQLKLRDDRFYTWTREFARDKETLKSSIEQLQRAAAELRAAHGGGTTPSRLEETASVDGERDGRHRRPRVSNEFIGIGAALGVEAVTAVTDPTAPSLIAGALGVLATGIPWIRKLKEERDADRS